MSPLSHTDHEHTQMQTIMFQQLFHLSLGSYADQEHERDSNDHFSTVPSHIFCVTSRWGTYFNI